MSCCSRRSCKALASLSSTSSGEISGAGPLGLKEDEGKGEDSHFCQETDQRTVRGTPPPDSQQQLLTPPPPSTSHQDCPIGQASLTVPHTHPPMCPLAWGNLWGQPQEVLSSQPQHGLPGSVQVLRQCIDSMSDSLLSACYKPGTVLGTEDTAKGRMAVFGGDWCKCVPKQPMPKQKGHESTSCSLYRCPERVCPGPNHTASWWQSWNSAFPLTLPWRHLWWGANVPPVGLSLPGPCEPPTSHTLPPQREGNAHQSSSPLLQSPESPGQEW